MLYHIFREQLQGIACRFKLGAMKATPSKIRMRSK